jgi:dTDP-4-amino-4,6-dideoxygalactose transaminase
MERLPITFPAFDSAEITNLRKCLDSKWVTQGPFTRQFECLFAARHSVPHAIATTSCTAALHLATLALGLCPGDEVIVPAFTWVTSAHSAEYVGARAVFADISLDTYNLDPAALSAAITPRTRAVVVVHLFGQAAPMDEILAIVRRHSLAVIEDAACAVGTAYAGEPVGGFGDLGCFSFHPRKVITTGEGGMITTRDESLARCVASLRNHGAGSTPPGVSTERLPPYHMGSFNALGFNLRLSDIQSAVGVAQLTKLDRLLDERRRLAQRYDELLAPVEPLATPHAAPRCGHTYQSYVVRLRHGGLSFRNRVMDYLDDQGIQTRPGTHAVHRLGYYVNKYGIRSDEFPNACLAEDTTITLPLFPDMTDADQLRVTACLRHALNARQIAA